MPRVLGVSPISVQVNFNVCIDAKGEIELFGETPPTPDNVIIALHDLPVTALYDETNEKGLIEVWEPSDAQGDIKTQLANTDSSGNGQGGPDLSGAYQVACKTFAQGLEAILCDEFDCSGVEPFKTYDGTPQYTMQRDFGRVALAYYAHHLFGHVDATAAITNDVAFVHSMLSTTTGGGQEDASGAEVRYAGWTKSTAGRVEDWDASGSELDANLALRLVEAVVAKGKDGSGNFVISSVNTAATDSLANIVKQVIRQDSSRQNNIDGSQRTRNQHQLLRFYADDIIYVNINVLPPTVEVAGFNPNPNNIANPPSTSGMTAKSFTLKIRLTDPNALPPTDPFVYTDGTKTVVSGYTGTIPSTLTIPAGVTGIADEAFLNATTIQSIVLPLGLTTIGARAFKGCTALTTIDIPSSVTSIAESAFEGCTALTTAALPGTGTKALKSIKPLQQTLLGTGVTPPAHLFKNRSLYKKKVAPAPAPAPATRSKPIAARLFSTTFSVIPIAAFKGCTALTTVTAPPGLLTIKESAFEGCTSLAGLTIPSGVVSIEQNAFKNTGLTSVSLPTAAGFQSISASTFEGCTQMTSVTIPTNVTSIGASAFSGSGLTSAIIPVNVTIGSGAFGGSVTFQYLDTGFIYGEAAKTTLYGYNGTPSGTLTPPSSVTRVKTSAFPAGSYTVRVPLTATIESNAFGAGVTALYIDYATSFIYGEAAKTTLYGYNDTPSGTLQLNTSVTTIKTGAFPAGSYTVYAHVGVTVETNAFGAGVTTLYRDIANSLLYGETEGTTLVGSIGTSYTGVLTARQSVTTVKSGAFSLTGNYIVRVPIDATIESGAIVGTAGTFQYIDYATNYIYGETAKTTLCGYNGTPSGTLTPPSSVTTIKTGAFPAGSYTVRVPIGLTIESSAFGAGVQVRYIDDATNYIYGEAAKTTLYGYNGTPSGTLTLPRSVTRVKTGAFPAGSYTVRVPIGLTIESSAFGAGVTTLYMEYAYATNFIYGEAAKSTLYGYNGTPSGILTPPSSVTRVKTGAFPAGSYTVYAPVGVTVETNAFGAGVTTLYRDIANSLLYGETEGTTLVGSIGTSYTGVLTARQSVTTVKSGAFSLTGNYIVRVPIDATIESGAIVGTAGTFQYIDYATNYIYGETAKTTLCGYNGTPSGTLTPPSSVTTIKTGAFPAGSYTVRVNINVTIESGAFGAGATARYIDYATNYIYGEAAKTNLYGYNGTPSGTLTPPSSVTRVKTSAFPAGSYTVRVPLTATIESNAFGAGVTALYIDYATSFIYGEAAKTTLYGYNGTPSGTLTPHGGVTRVKTGAFPAGSYTVRVTPAATIETDAFGAGVNMEYITSPKQLQADWALSMASDGASLGSIASLGYSVKVDRDGSIYVAGTTTVRGTLYVPNISGNSHTLSSIYLTSTTTSTTSGYLIKYNSDGIAQWATTIPTNDAIVQVRAVAIDSSGNITITGYYGGTTAILLQDASGNTHVNSTVTLPISATPAENAFIIQYSSSGSVQWATTIRGNRAGYQTVGYGIVVDASSNHVYVTGSYVMSDTTTRLTLQDASGNGQVNSAVSLPANVANNGDVFLVKYTSSGQVVWATAIRGTSTTGGVDDAGYALAIDSANNVYVTGSYLTSNTTTAIPLQDASGNEQVNSAVTLSPYVSNNDLFLVKYNSSGSVQWATAIRGTSNDIGYALAVDASNNVYVTGRYTMSTTTTRLTLQDALLTADGSGNWQVNSAVSLPTSISASTADIFLVKYNSSGSVQWATAIRGTATSASDIGYALAVDASNNVYVTGQYAMSNTTTRLTLQDALLTADGSGNWQVNSAVSLPTSISASTADIFLVKYNSSGSVQWATAIRGTATSASDIGYALAVDASNNVFMTGVYYTASASYTTPLTLQDALLAADGGGNWQVNSAVTLPANNTTGTSFLAKYNSSGTVQFACPALFPKSVTNITTAMRSHSMAKDASGNLYVTGGYFSSHSFTLANRNGSGQTQSTVTLPASIGTSTSVYDAYIIKYDVSGSVQWATTIRGTSTSGADAGYGIAVDASNNVYVTGQYTMIDTTTRLTLQDASGNGQADSQVSLPPCAANNVPVVFLVSYTASGSVQWATAIRGTATSTTVPNTGYGIAVDASNNVYVTGQYAMANTTSRLTLQDASGNVQANSLVSLPPPATLGYSNAFLVKYNSSGSVQWATSIRGTTTFTSVPNVGYGIVVDAANNVYVTGQYAMANTTTRLTLQDASGNVQADSLVSLPTSMATGSTADVFLVKYSPSGSVQWATAIRGTSNDTVYGIATDASNNVYLTGQYRMANTTTRLTLQDASGNVQADSLVSLPANVANSADVFLVKYSPSGSVQWATAVCGNGSSADTGNGIAIDANANVYITGSYYSTAAVAILDASGATQSTAAYTLPVSTTEAYYVIKYDSNGLAKAACSLVPSANLTTNANRGYSCVCYMGKLFVYGSYNTAGVTLQEAAYDGAVSSSSVTLPLANISPFLLQYTTS